MNLKKIGIRALQSVVLIGYPILCWYGIFGATWAMNIFKFATWALTITYFIAFMAMPIEEVSRPVKWNANAIGSFLSDAAILVLLAATGHFFYATLVLIQQGCEQQIRKSDTYKVVRQELYN